MRPRFVAVLAGRRGSGLLSLSSREVLGILHPFLCWEDGGFSMEGRSVDGQRDLRLPSHCVSMCSCLWGEGSKLSTVSEDSLTPEG